jgi:peptidylprolyl isomerase
MVQTGDPTGTGMGGSKLPDLKAEFSDEPHIRGTLSIARASDPNSANSQFFIVTKDSRFLDNQYTVFGRVIKGMEFVDKIKKGNSNQNGKVENPDSMIKVRVASDEKK